MESPDHTYPQAVEHLGNDAVHLDHDVLQAFTQQARRLGVPLSQLVNQVLRRHLDGVAD